MPQVDSSAERHLRRPLDFDPTQGQGQVLPKGWGSFRSEPGSNEPSHYYASAPWNAEALRDKYGEAARELANTVSATTLRELCDLVSAQVSLYRRLTSAQ